MSALEWAIVAFVGYPPFAFLFLRFWALRRPVPPPGTGEERRTHGGKDHVDGVW